MTKEEKNHIISAFYSWKIEDPYPEHTKFQKFPFMHPDPGITPHQAWRDGYEFAKNLIFKRLDHMKETE